MIPCPAVSLPGLSAVTPTMSLKIIPCISRAMSTALRRCCSCQLSPGSSGGKLTRTAGPPGPRTGSGAAELRITRVFSCVARGFKARASFMFAGCCWWRSLAVDGGSGTSRGHGSVMRRPGSRWDGAVERPSVFQAGHIPSCADVRASAVPPVADACRWPLLLLSPLLSARRRPSGSKPARTVQGDGPRPVRAGSGLALVF